MPENGFTKIVRRAEAYWADLGPGLVTGAADDDPSGIATYSQAGAKFGFGMLWLALFTFPFMAIVQEMCARIGLATGSGLAANIRTHYARKTLYVCTALLFFANVLNIGADLGAMAASVRLIVPALPVMLLLIAFAFISLVLQIFTTYARYSKYLKYLTLALAAYVLTAFSVHVDWGSVFAHTIIPTFHSTKEYILLLCAVLGTTISPYLFFWQTSQEIEEKILLGQVTIDERKAAVRSQDIKKMRIDVWSGMLFSNAAMFFIIVASAAALYSQGVTNIATAADAALALRPFAGNAAFALFTLGIVGTGLLAIPILAGSASYAISESFGWKHGLFYKLRQAYAFYGVIIVAMVIGLLINLLNINPINALLYSAVANGLIAPIMLFFIIRISSNKEIMGVHANKSIISGLGWLITVVMALSGIAAIAFLFV